MKKVLEIAGCPPSLNLTRSWHWSKARRLRRNWQDWMGWAAYEAIGPVVEPFSAAHATAELVFKVNRRRDEGNFRSALEKALGDALVERGYLRDDTPDRFTFGKVTFRKGKQDKTLITLTLKGAK
jgi:hypothetical protein